MNFWDRLFRLLNRISWKQIPWSLHFKKIEFIEIILCCYWLGQIDIVAFDSFQIIFPVKLQISLFILQPLKKFS